MLPIYMCLCICDYVKSWPSMFETKLDELLTNQLYPLGVHIVTGQYLLHMQFRFWQFGILTTVKISIVLLAYSTHNSQKFTSNNYTSLSISSLFYKNPINIELYVLLSHIGNLLYRVYLDLFVYLVTSENKFATHNIENKGILFD